jgi:hypothetical protein
MGREIQWEAPTLMRPMSYCKKIGHWKNEYSCHKGTASEPNKISPGKKTGWQLKAEAQVIGRN